MPRILVIDDDRDVCDSIARLLAHSGYEVLTAYDGASGLELCRKELPDVVLTDIIMPGQHGAEVIRSLRSSFPTIGIIAISGGGNAAIAGYQPGAIKTAAYMAAAESAGAHFCLTKPFEREHLLNGIRALLARNAARH
jgi:DNA-binding response OmpR family regulator